MVTLLLLLALPVDSNPIRASTREFPVIAWSEKNSRPLHPLAQEFYQNSPSVRSQLTLTTRLDERSPAVAIFSLSLNW